jgi:hypothetical protein
MKTLFFFLSAFSLFAQADYTLLMQSKGSPPPAAPTYFFQENFEGDGYQNTWTPGGATPYANPDTNSPVMQGTNACGIGLATTFTYAASEFTAKDEVWGKFMVNKADTGSGQNNSAKLTLSRTGVANDLEIAFQAGGIIGVKHGTVNVTGAYTMGEGTNYWIWFHFAKGTGANGVAEVFVSTSDSRPGSAEVVLTSGDGTASPSAVSMQATAEQAFFDDIKLSETGYPTP